MNLIFLGSGTFGLPTLKAMHLAHHVVAVISQPDKPAGRKKQLTPTPIAQYALEQGLTLLRTDNVNAPAFVEKMSAYRPEAAVVIAFGQKLSPAFLETLGPLTVNLHASLLPQYRGAAPINWALMHDQPRAGVCVIGLAQKMDAGDIYASQDLAIDPLETAGELHDRLADLGPSAVLGVLEDLQQGQLNPVAQDHAQATLAPKLTKADGTVDFDAPACEVRARVHGLTPWPGCCVLWTSQKTGKTQPLFLRRVSAEPTGKVASPGLVLENHRVAVADGAIHLLALQLPGKRLLPVADFVRGHPLMPGDQLATMV